MKNFLAIASLAIFLSACGSEDDGLPSATTGVVNGTDVAYVGTITSSSPILPATGSCKISDAAMQMPDITVGGKKVSPLPSPMKYLVAASNILFCTWGVAEGAGTTINLDFSQGPLAGTTCQDLVSDTSDALKRIPSMGYPMVPGSDECCELVSVPSGGGGYAQTEGITCGNGTASTSIIAGGASGTISVRSIPISAALCSITGEFMGWACQIPIS